MSCATDCTDQWLEYRADRIAATSSYRYAKGGVEFMKNCMQLDALLRYGPNYTCLCLLICSSRDNDSKSSLHIVDKVKKLFSNHPPHDSECLPLFC